MPVSDELAVLDGELERGVSQRGGGRQRGDGGRFDFHHGAFAGQSEGALQNRRGGALEMDALRQRGIMGHHLIRGHILAPDPNCVADGAPVQNSRHTLRQHLCVETLGVLGAQVHSVHACSGEGEERKRNLGHFHFVGVAVTDRALAGIFGKRGFGGFVGDGVSNEVVRVGVN